MVADQPLWITFIVGFIVLNALLGAMAYMTWLERKVIALMQDRIGPNRTGPFGLLQPIADGIKLLGKEDLVPKFADKRVFVIAPLLSFVTAPLAAMVIPFGDTVTIFGQEIRLYVTDINVAVLYVLAVGSVGVYGIILGGTPPRIDIRCWERCGRQRRLSRMRSFLACRSSVFSSSPGPCHW
jgi:NADH-quinone oxidoreductase subunit H